MSSAYTRAVSEPFVCMYLSVDRHVCMYVYEHVRIHVYVYILASAIASVEDDALCFLFSIWVTPLHA